MTQVRSVVPTRLARPAGLFPLAVATAIGSAGLAAGGNAGALVAVDITGTSGVAGLPVTALIVGTAIAAILISRSAARGRRGRGLALGYVLGVFGALTVVYATVARDLTVLLIGSAMLGAASAAVFLTRYAAADLGPRSIRGRVLGVFLAAAAGGAAFGPLLLGPAGQLARAIALPTLTGLYLLAVVCFCVAAALLTVAANPRTPWFGRAATVLRGSVDRRPVPLRDALRTGGARPAFVALGTANFIMVGTTAVAPVHMLTHGQGVNLVGAVIALHVAGMFAPAPLAGRLVDRSGPTTTVVVGNTLLLFAGIMGALGDGEQVTGIAVGLVILGVGWNFCVVGGSSLLADSVPAALRPDVEGIGEVAMCAAGAVAAPAAGLGLAVGSYSAVTLTGTVLAAVALGLVHRRHRSSRRQAWRSAHQTAHL